MPKSVPKTIQTCLRVIFSKKKICPVFHGGSSFRKISNFFFKIPKKPKFVPESIQTCFERVLGQIFRKIFLPSVPWRVEFSKISKKKIFSKFQKCPKVFPKVSKRVLNMFWGKFLEKFYAQCSMEGRVFENFQNIFFQNSKNAQNCSQKYPNMFRTCFGANFSKIFCPVFHGV